MLPGQDCDFTVNEKCRIRNEQPNRDQKKTPTKQQPLVTDQNNRNEDREIEQHEDGYNHQAVRYVEQQGDGDQIAGDWGD